MFKFYETEKGRLKMFCTKCGFNAGEAKFCPKCGNTLSVNVEKLQPEQPMQPIQPVQLVQPEQPIQQSQNEIPYQTVQLDNMQYQQAQQMNNAYQPIQQMDNAYHTVPNGNKTARKKKKKGPLVLIAVVAFIALLGVGGYLMYPYIESALSPKKDAVTALKAASAGFETSFNETVDGINISAGSKINSEGFLTVEKLTVENTDYLKQVKVNTLNYDIFSDVENLKTSGTIGLSDGSSSSVINAKYYMDKSKIYVSVPELFSDKFVLDLSSSDADDLYRTYSKIAGTVSAEDEQVYKNLAKKLVSYGTDCFDECVDASQITKNKEKIALQVDGKEAKAVTYNVLLESRVLEEKLLSMIDKMYSDSEVSVYMTMLSTFGNVKKDDLRQSVKDFVQDVGNVEYMIYVVDKKIVKATTADSEGIEYVLDFTSQNAVSYSVLNETSTATLTCKNDNEAIKISAVIKEDNEELSMYVDISKDNDKLKLNELSAKSTISNAGFDIKLKGENRTDETQTMKVDVGDFSGAYNPDNATDEQMIKLGADFIKNFPVLKKVVSDEVYQSIYRAIIGASVYKPSTEVPAEEVPEQSVGGPLQL